MRIKGNSKRLYASLALAVSMQFGFVGTSGAATCSTSDVTINGLIADSCGSVVGNTLTPDFNDPNTWSVNIDSIAGGGWNYFEKVEEAVPPPGNAHEGNTAAINLSVDQLLTDGINSGTFSLNMFDPTLITLKGGTNYNWYLFTVQTGASTGAFNTANLGANLSSLSAYTTVVPVPAAVWLFATGLLGLVGVARKRA